MITGRKEGRVWLVDINATQHVTVIEAIADLTELQADNEGNGRTRVTLKSGYNFDVQMAIGDVVRLCGWGG
jgi:hypothetical protein